MAAERELWIVAGEPSGDTHGAHLLRALQEQDPGLRFRGYGGPRMAEAGMTVLHDLASDAIMGIFPVVAALPRIWKLFQGAVRELEERRPAALLLVDYPGFNIRLAAKAHALGIPVIYYISPQVWAWARWRVKKLARVCDLMLVILPFEERLFADSGLKTVFVGHPLMDHLNTVTHDRELMGSLREGLPAGAPLVGIFPGSRRSVIRSLAPTFAEAARRLRSRPGMESARFAVACSHERFLPLVEPAFEGLDAKIVCQRPYDVMEAADLALTSSGTTTLELTAHLTPFVLGYRVSPLVYLLGKILVKIDHIGLVNLVAGERLVPEHVGVRSFAREAAEDLHQIWSREGRLEQQREGLARVRDALRTEGSYQRAAQTIVAQLAPQDP